MARMTNFLTVKEVATMCRVKTRTVRRWIAQGLVPAVQPGRQWLIDKHDIKQFIESRGNNNG